MEEMTGRMEKAHKGDKVARDSLVTENLGLVHAVIRRFENRGHDREELFQIGGIGLMKSVDKFDTSLGLAFSTYAVPMIMGEIRRFLRDDGMVKVSRSLKENGYKIRKAKDLLGTELGREPTLLEIAALTELSTEDVVLALEANSQVESIYRPMFQSDGEELLLIDQLNGAQGMYEVHGGKSEQEQLLNEILIGQLLESLEERERQLIQYRYFENLTQTAVADRLDMNQVQVSRMEKKILRKLRIELQK